MKNDKYNYHTKCQSKRSCMYHANITYLWLYFSDSFAQFFLPNLVSVSRHLHISLSIFSCQSAFQWAGIWRCNYEGGLLYTIERSVRPNSSVTFHGQILIKSESMLWLSIT